MKYKREILLNKDFTKPRSFSFLHQSKKSKLKNVFVKIKWQSTFQLKILPEPAQNSILPLVWTLYVCIKIMYSGCNYWKRVSKVYWKEILMTILLQKQATDIKHFDSVLIYSWSGRTYQQISGWKCNIGS